MKYSIVNYQDIDELSFRFDAEFYHPEYLSNQLIIKKYENGHIKFGKIIKYISGGATPLGANYPETGIPFLRVQNIMNNYFNDDDIVYITEADHDLLKRSKLKENDVLLTITGISYGKSAVVIKKYEGANINQHSVKIELDTSRFLPYFISTFLNSSYGKKQSDKFIVGITRPALDYKRIREYLIPLLSLDFQRLIEKIGIKSHNTIDHANYLYSQAEHILLSELDLLNWKQKHRLSFVKKYSDTQSALRIDAEYFQPMYEEIIKELVKYKNGYGSLGDLVKIKDRNFIPKDEVSYKYIELANISVNGNITGFTEALGNELPTRARRKINRDDVIVSSIGGSLSSIALITELLDNALCSTGFYVVNSENINSETSLVFLKSKAGQLQLKKGCSGTILTAISKDEFAKLIIPKIADKIQNEIKIKITEMYKAKTLSNELLNIAKRGVEIAIEKDEKQAQNWINSEMKKLNIK